MAAGAMAGTATVFLTNPIWVVNTRMTARKSGSDDSSPTLPTSEDSEKEQTQSPTTIGTLLKIIKEDGFMRLFAGVMPALVLVLNPILQYTVYERLKQMLEKTRKVGARESFVLGAIGKLVATGVTYPYITVKARAHVATGDSAKEGMTASLRRIVREEGVQGLYGGECLLRASSSGWCGLLIECRYCAEDLAVCDDGGVLVCVQGYAV
jgi:adenine nucleotide transporter 17